MTIALIVGSIATMRSTSYLETEIDKKIITTAEKYANDFSAEFNHMAVSYTHLDVYKRQVHGI